MDTTKSQKELLYDDLRKALDSISMIQENLTTVEKTVLLALGSSLVQEEPK